MLPGFSRAHFLTLLEGDGDLFALFPHVDDAAIAKVLEFDSRQATRLAEILEVEAADAVPRNVHYRV